MHHPLECQGVGIKFDQSGRRLSGPFPLSLRGVSQCQARQTFVNARSIGDIAQCCSCQKVKLSGFQVIRFIARSAKKQVSPGFADQKVTGFRLSEQTLGSRLQLRLIQRIQLNNTQPYEEA